MAKSQRNGPDTEGSRVSGEGGSVWSRRGVKSFGKFSF